MRITTDRIGILLNYGLSEYQARVYLALLEFPALNAGTLAKVAQVPRNRLYEVLEDLQTLGLVEIILDEETRKYRAKPLATYLDRRVQDLNDRIAEIESRRDYLTVAFQPPEFNASGELDLGTTRVAIGRRAVAREIDRLLEGARTSLIVVSSVSGTERIVRHLAPYADEIESRPNGANLTIEIYLPRAAAGAGGVERLGKRLLDAVRWLDFPMGTMSFIVDAQELLLVHPIPDDDRVHTGRDFALLTTNPAFVRDHLELVRRAGKTSAVST